MHTVQNYELSKTKQVS